MNEDDFQKEIIIKEKSKEEKELELITSIIKTKQDLDTASLNFESAQGDLIDYYTYQIKANRSKLDHLLKKAKNLSLSLDMIEQLNIRYNNVI